MRTTAFSILFILMLPSLSVARAESGSEAPDLTLEAAPEPRISYEEFKVQELERLALRSRNALIGTSVAAAVGLALVIPAGATQCNSVEKTNGDDSYECTRAGNALIGAGSPLVIGGLTGAVITGIMLGVRKGKLRRLNDAFVPNARAVQWDERRGRFVF